MYRIIPTARFRKDLKRAAKRGLPMERVVDVLSAGETLAPKYRVTRSQGTISAIVNAISSRTGF